MISHFSTSFLANDIIKNTPDTITATIETTIKNFIAESLLASKVLKHRAIAMAWTANTKATDIVLVITVDKQSKSKEVFFFSLFVIIPAETLSFKMYLISPPKHSNRFDIAIQTATATNIRTGIILMPKRCILIRDDVKAVRMIQSLARPDENSSLLFISFIANDIIKSTPDTINVNIKTPIKYFISESSFAPKVLKHRTDAMTFKSNTKTTDIILAKAINQHLKLFIVISLSMTP